MNLLKSQRILLAICGFFISNILHTISASATEKTLAANEGVRQRIGQQIVYGYNTSIDNCLAINTKDLEFYVTSKEPKVFFEAPKPPCLYGQSTPQGNVPRQHLIAHSRLDLRMFNEQNINAEVYKQWGSTCSVYAICSAIDYLRLRNPVIYANISPRSPRFGYYLYRDWDLNHSDIGSSPRLLIGQLRSVGICGEDKWSFPRNSEGETILQPERISEKPSEDAFHDAFRNRILKFNYIGLYKYNGTPLIGGQSHDRRLINLGVLIDYLDYYKLPILCTLDINKKEWFRLNDSYKVGNPFKTIVDSLPDETGKHCVLIIGVDLSKKSFIIQNSWGNQWGDKECGPGCRLVNFDLFSKTAEADFWQITAFGSENPTQSSIYLNLMEKYILPFARRNRVIDEIDENVQDELNKSVPIYQSEEEYFKETISYVFNNHFQLGTNGTLLDRMVVLTNFSLSRDLNKNLNKFRDVYSFLLDGQLDTFNIETLCRRGFADWLKLKCLIKHLREIENEDEIHVDIVDYTDNITSESSILTFGIQIIQSIYNVHGSEYNLDPAWVTEQTQELTKKLNL